MTTSVPSRKKPAEDRYMVPVLQSTFQVLTELARAKELNLNDLIERTAIPKSTVFRILRTLVHLGYVARDEARRSYWLSPKLGEFARTSHWGDAIRSAALPHMIRLRDEFGETVNLGHLSVDRVIYLEVVSSEHALRLCERPGNWDALHSSALGKAILASCAPELVRSLLYGRPLEALTPNTITDPDRLIRELDQVRLQGYAFDDEECTLLGACVGAPIFDAQGNAVAALSISGPSSRFKPRRDRRLLDALVEATRDISRSLGHASPAVAELEST